MDNESLLQKISQNKLDTSLIGTPDLDSFLPVPVACLLGSLKQHFFIPSYQRGYRWEHDQIQDLLDDLYEFSSPKNKDEIYWLQPIVLKKKEWKDIKGTLISGWEVVDGQQRLTSIFLLLSFLSDNIENLYDITYETRPEIKFTDIMSINENSDIDSDYIKSNYLYIRKWFELKSKETDTEVSDLKDDFKKCLSRRDASRTTKMAAFIVYILDANLNTTSVNTNDLVKKFNNLNKNQIKLTGSELLKAQFVLSFNNSQNNSVPEFISKWNQMEYTLQDNELWNFISNEPGNSTRIDILFDIYTNKPANELKKGYSYRKIKNEIASCQNADEYLFELWKKIQEIFEILILCFKEKKVRHYAGFLIAVKEKNWYSLYEDLKNLNKKNLTKVFNSYICEFLNKIKKEKNSIVTNNNTIASDILDDLDYDKDLLNIRNLLLLHNIIFCINSDSYDFSFSNYKDKKNKCDVEHIDPHTPNNLTKYDDLCIYINGMSEKSLNFLWESDLNKRASVISELFSLQKSIMDIKNSQSPKKQIDDDKRIFLGEVNQFIEEYKNELGNYRRMRNNNSLSTYSTNSIANLVLLNYDINREYHNRPFPDKHETVLKAELTGKFIPVCTKFAFSKKYRTDFTTASDPDWNEEDKKAYFDDIVKSFNLVLQEKLI